jgi:hypothetical protein
MQEVPHIAVNFMNYVLKFAKHAQKNAKNTLLIMLAARNALKLVKNVLKYVRNLPLVKSNRDSSFNCV